MWNSEFKLAIYSDNPDYRVDLNELETLLKKLALIGAPLSKNRYTTGDNFLSLLTFLGCSPNIELEPLDDQPYCYIEIESHAKPQFISGKNTKYPPCPYCKSTLENTQCENCNETIKEADLAKLNWRKSAFIASSWITIGNIYELEAIPNDQLLNALHMQAGTQWKAAYIRCVDGCNG